MNKIALIARRDLAAMLNSLSGWLTIAAVLLFLGGMFQAISMGTSARYSHEVLESFFYFSFGFTVVISLLLTMRSIAEERQQGTDVLLHASPISETQIIAGKYLSAMAILSIFLLLTTYMPALIFVNGKVSISHIAVGYLGLLGIGSATAAIGIFASSLFRYQILAGVFGGVIAGLFIISWTMSSRVDAPFSEILHYSAFFQGQFASFQKGILSTEGLIYFASITFVFLSFATRVLEGRRVQ